jgi:hypothetical protein
MPACDLAAIVGTIGSFYEPAGEGGDQIHDGAVSAPLPDLFVEDFYADISAVFHWPRPSWTTWPSPK